MYIDEFLKRLYDFMGIYRIFWSQNSHYRYLPIFYGYLPIFYRYFTDIYRYLPIFYQYFFRNSSTSACAPQSRFFGGKSVFSDFSVKNLRFYRFFPDFSSHRFFLCFFFLVLAENRFFGDISTEKTDFFVPAQVLIFSKHDGNYEASS